MQEHHETVGRTRQPDDSAKGMGRMPQENNLNAGQADVLPNVSHMSVTELINFCLQLRSKSDSEWERVINVHAALIGVMIFFAGQEYPYVTARLVVFAFYSFNVVSSYLSLKETFDGLRRISEDLRLFGQPALGGASFAWITSRRYTHHVWFRSGLLACVWLIVGYLMITPLVFGHNRFWP
ncbi:MAG: hypothetical protein Q8Q26_02685 [Pseudorhodobacter sp.]|nr:hypothetical protein [Pseudorhodobacter sp.]